LTLKLGTATSEDKFAKEQAITETLEKTMQVSALFMTLSVMPLLALSLTSLGY
jgi:hypothetical protein